MTAEPAVGDRIRLILMPADPNPIPIGTFGTLQGVYSHCGWTQVEVDWDNGRRLMLSLPDDQIESLRPGDIQF